MASDINPSLTPTKSLSNFRFWCQKVLPLVYDDSLSYYEVLGKMVVQLNDVIDDVNADTENVLTLKEAFLALQTYVNEFFADIDQLASYAERAEDAQTAANASAINAAASASNASASSLAAMNARDAAVTAKDTAVASANTASTAATNANTKASEAAQSAITAQTAQASASESATLAATDRSAAQTAASTATSKASEANTSAENAAQSATNAEDAAASVEASAEQIATNTSDIVDLKDVDNYLIGKNITKTNLENSGNRISFNCLNAPQTTARRLQTLTIFQAGEYGPDNNVMSIETSGFAENGVVKYAIKPLPANILVPFKNEGLIILTDSEIIGRAIKTKYLVSSLTNQNNKTYGEQISLFNEDVTTIRACIIWHYITNTASENALIPNSESGYIISALQ